MTASYGVDDFIADIRRVTAQTVDESEIFDRLGPLPHPLAAAKSCLQPEC